MNNNGGDVYITHDVFAWSQNPELGHPANEA